MNNQTLKIISLLAIGILAILPVLTFAGTCGMGSDCEFCLTQETCEVPPNCAWETTTCVFDGIVPINLTFGAGALAYVSELFTNLSLLVGLVIGLPLAFWAIRRVVGLVRAR